MKLTNEQEEQMRRAFPNGWEESNIPAFWRKGIKVEPAKRIKNETYPTQQKDL